MFDWWRGRAAGEARDWKGGWCCLSWDDVRLSPLTCMSLAIGKAFERGIGFGFVFFFCIGPSRVRSGRDRFSRRCPNDGVSVGVLSGPIWLPDGGGACKSAHRSRPGWAQRSPVGTSKGCGSLPLLFCVPFRR